MKSIHDQHLIQLIEPGHKYVVKNYEHLRFTSVTTFIHDFFPPFDAPAIAAKLSGTGKYKNKSANQILKEWKDFAEEGTAVHEELEKYAKAWDYIKSPNPKDLLTRPKSQHGGLWLSTVLEPHYKLYPEVRIFSEYYQLSGTIDLLIYNELTDEWVLADWKTNGTISTSGWNGATGTHYATKLIPDSNFWHYTMQFSLYQFILEREYDIKIKNRFLIHLLPKQTAKFPLGVKIYDTDYMRPAVIAMLEKREDDKNKAKLFYHDIYGTRET